MCLAVPGKVVAWLRNDPPFVEAWVEFAGVRRRTNLACVPDAQVGDYVLVHAGIAISCLDEAAHDEVQASLRELNSMTVPSRNAVDQPPRDAPPSP